VIHQGKHENTTDDFTQKQQRRNDTKLHMTNQQTRDHSETEDHVTVITNSTKTADQQLFHKINSYSNHVLHTLLPQASVASQLGMLTRLARLEKNFSVSSIEFLAVEKCDKQLDDDRRSFNDGRYAKPPAGSLRVSWESVNRVGSLDGNYM